MAKDKDQREAEERLRQTIRELDFGDGVEVTMGLGDRVTYRFSNNLKPLQKTTGTPIAVEFSSSEAENKELLHHLLQRTRAHS